ncbi:MAG: hypothetical protein Q4A83_02725 [Bacillota bacterium]|nr:hypothetical protein [Bacillota bacterium]
MSKYAPLWNRIRENGKESFTLSFAEIEQLAGVPLDHSFLNCKKELQAYGYQVSRISMKAATVDFEKLPA